MTDIAQMVSGRFSASGTITVDASGISASNLRKATDGMLPVLTVPTAQVPADVSWVLANDPLFHSKLLWQENGNVTSTLYLRKTAAGLILIVN